ncbi:hypothetical protein ACXDF8_03490 [Mycolicibacterium sp. CBM1]
MADTVEVWRWIPAAILAAGLIVAVAVVGAAGIVVKNAKPAVLVSAPQKARTDEVLTSSTCRAWEITRSALGAVPPLPESWSADTPDAGAAVTRRAAALGKVVDFFAPQVGPEPADVAAAANDFIAAQRRQIQLLRDRSYTDADGVSVNLAAGRLDQLCAVYP